MLTLMGEHDKYEGIYAPRANLTTHASSITSPLHDALPETLMVRRSDT
jgi:hypothetical protein